jgi:L-alanine-DL-glutamate epimerase-like enolase superfamily enzyme
MEIRFQKFNLELKHKFGISYSTRTFTPAVIIKIIQGEFCGFGEASLPPYLCETQDSVISFLSGIKLRDINSITDLTTLTSEINFRSPGNFAAKAAINIALHDLLGKISGLPCYKLYNIFFDILPYTSFTIGIDSPEMIVKKVEEAESFRILKVKLGIDNDREIIETIRNITDKPIYADANQGWKDKHNSLEFIYFLEEKNVLLVEQPFPVKNISDSAWLSERSPLPIIADESFQTADDLETIKNSFNGINIKLMKCGGLSEAYKLIEKGRECNLKIMLGCMTESSCAISAALHFSSLADFADLDGNLLIANDPFICTTVIDGRLTIPAGNGLGIIPDDKRLFIK